MNWREQARCRDLPVAVSDRMFFPDTTPTATTVAYCGTCPVRDDCRQFADDTRQAFGVYGGESAAHRRRRVGIKLTEDPLAGLPFREGVRLDEWPEAREKGA